MKKASVIGIMFLCIVFSFTPVNAEDGLFGLSWGMTYDQVKAKGVVLTPVGEEGGISMYTAESLPLDIGDVHEYALLFTKKRGLLKVGVYFNKIEDDIYGTKGKEDFKQLSDILKQKYTAGECAHDVGGKLFKARDEFYQCLKYKGCGLWLSLFNSEDRNISLRLDGLARGTGQISLIFEAVPGWKVTLKEKAEAEAKQRANAF